MSLRYCKKCRHILDDSVSVKRYDRFFCNDCRHELSYFGAESVELSDEDQIKAYDDENPFDPLKDYSGRFYTDSFRMAKDPVAYLECEDILVHQPKNKDALLYLAKYHWSQSSLTMSQQYFERYLEENALSEQEAELYCELLVSLDKGKTLIQFLKQHAGPYSNFFKTYYMAMACLSAKQYKKALKYFYDAYVFCKDEANKDSIKGMIKDISDYLESEAS